MKLSKQLWIRSSNVVEAYVASWIEILPFRYILYRLLVEAYVASWIEMFMIGIMILMTLVEAYVASWIEILCWQGGTAVAWSRLT